MYILLINAVMGLTNAHAATAEFFGQYQGVCAETLPGATSPAAITVTYDDQGLTLSHPMPTRRDGHHKGNPIPGRTWQVHYDWSHLVNTTNDTCVDVMVAPRVPLRVASLCFSKVGAAMTPQVVLTPHSDNLMCGEVSLERSRTQAELVEARPKLRMPLTWIQVPIVRRDFGSYHQTTGARVDAARPRLNSGEFLASYRQGRSSNDLFDALRAGFSQASTVDMTTRSKMMELLINDLDPEVRAKALTVLGQEMPTPLAIPPVLAALNFERENSKVIEAAILAAEPLLQSIQTYLGHREQLRNRFGAVDLERIFANTRGEVEAIHFPAIAALENYALPEGAWSLAQRDALIEGLIGVAEAKNVSLYNRTRAAKLGRTYATSRDRHARMKGLYGRLIRRKFVYPEIADKVLRHLDIKNEEFMRFANFRLKQHAVHPLRVRCEKALEQIAR